MSTPLTAGPAGTLSARPQNRRVLFLALTLLMYGFVLAGFWPYWRVAGTATPPRPWLVHVHAAVYTGWMALLLAQVLLVRKRDIKRHKQLGQFGIYYGALVFLMGIVAMIVAPAVHVLRNEWTLDRAAGFLIFPVGDMVLFGSLFGAAIIYRNRPDIHKRLILLATIALIFAPVSRMVGAAGPLAVVLTCLSPALIHMAADWRQTRRVHPALLVGTAWMIIGIGRVAFQNSPAWISFGRGFVTAVTPFVERLM